MCHNLVLRGMICILLIEKNYAEVRAVIYSEFLPDLAITAFWNLNI